MSESLSEVHIVTLNWNGLMDTLECLESIRRLKTPHVTAIVVDNGSTGEQADEIEKLFPEAVVLRQAENLGFCGGCNVGIKYALEHDADYVMLLNNDAMVSPDLIERMLEGMSGISALAAASPLILYYPETERVWYSRAYWEPDAACFYLAAPDDNKTELEASQPFQTTFACGCCMLVPADVFRRVGLLDERYFAFFDEAAWCSSAAKHGLNAYVIPKAHIYHKVSKSTPSIVATYLMNRNRLLWMRENLPIRTAMRSAPFLLKQLFGHLANLLHLTKEHTPRATSKAALWGYLDFLRGRFSRWGRPIDRLTSRN